MLLSVGIDVAEARKGLDLVAMDSDRRVVLTEARATVERVLELVDGLRPDVVCIDAPPAWSTVRPTRAGERELRRLGITAFSTPTDPGDHPFYRWMRAGFATFEALAAQYPRYRSGPMHGTALEVFPEASAVLLRGHLRPAHESKSAFRRAVLADQGVDHSRLRSIDAVDAALAALTGLLALEGTSCAVGDPSEGVIVLPVAVLPSTRLVRPATPSTAAATPRPRREGSATVVHAAGVHVIRRAVEADLSALLRIDPIAAAGDPHRIDLLSAAAAGDRCCCLVAADGATLLGFVVTRQRHFFDRDFVELLLVAEGQRRRGIGRALLRAAVEASSTPHVFTSTNESNASMRALLAAEGWRRSGRLIGLDDGDAELVVFRSR